MLAAREWVPRMRTITFDKFSSGLDRRKSRDTAGADALFEMTNAFVTAGHEIRKRGCAVVYASIEAGSVGLFSALGGLHAFVDDPGITHGDPLITAQHVPHPTNPLATLQRIYYCDAFQGYLYVVAQYDNGDIFHHYLDAGSSSATPRYASPAWTAATAYETTSPHYVTPTVPNGFRYECTASGTSGGSEPAWPTTIGATVTDGTVTWTARSFVITDPNCPHSRSVVKIKSKLFATAGDTVAFSATAAARDWSTASDAGFLATGNHQDDSSEALAVGKFKSNLAVYFADAVQIWFADPSPNNIILTDIVPNIGTRYPRSTGQVSQDTIFLSDNGFRSLALSSSTDQLEDSDIGAPVDDIVVTQLPGLIDPFTEWYGSRPGQLWTVLDTRVWAFTYSRSSKVSAWSRFTFPFPVEYAANLNGRLYLRSGNNVYVMDDNAHQDDIIAPEVVIEFPFLDFQQPGKHKYITGVDFVGRGTASVTFKYRTTDLAGNPTEGETDPVTMTDNSIPGVLTPVELVATAIAPRIVHRANESFELSRLVFYFETMEDM